MVSQPHSLRRRISLSFSFLLRPESKPHDLFPIFSLSDASPSSPVFAARSFPLIEETPSSPLPPPISPPTSPSSPVQTIPTSSSKRQTTPLPQFRSRSPSTALTRLPPSTSGSPLRIPRHRTSLGKRSWLISRGLWTPRLVKEERWRLSSLLGALWLLRLRSETDGNSVINEVFVVR